VAPELAAKFPPERYGAFIRFLEDTTAAADIPFLNYYQARNVPSDGFFDHHHLNDKGAEVFSRQIAEEVVAPALRDWQGFKYALKLKTDRTKHPLPRQAS
jgi:lysophospholipase L1-like esterase